MSDHVHGRGCGCPSPAELKRQTAEHIATVGQSVIGVADDVPFAYTIGNHGAGYPELLLFIDMHTGMRLLNVFGRIMRERGRPFADGELIDLGGKFPVKAVTAAPDASERYAFQAHQFYGVAPAAVRVTQILLPDRQGRFPGEPGCEPPFSRQPVLAVN